MKTKAKFEFYRATQKVKPGKWCQLYDGVIIEKSKEIQVNELLKNLNK